MLLRGCKIAAAAAVQNGAPVEYSRPSRCTEEIRGGYVITSDRKALRRPNYMKKRPFRKTGTAF
jgi:hypothetical protein